MKRLKLLIVLIVLATTAITNVAFAQENIKAMLKKCEEMDVIEASYVRNNANALIRTPIRSTMNMKLHYTPELADELVAAFYKDKAKASSEVEQKRDGKVINMLYRFDDATYSFTIINDTISIQAVERNYSFRFR
jgi:putative cell wall-binding protein